MCQIFFMIMTPNFHKGSHQYQFTYLSILVIPSRLAAKCENLVITHLLFTCQNSWAFFCPTIFFAVNHCLDFFSKTKISSDSWSPKFLQIYQEILTAVDKLPISFLHFFKKTTTTNKQQEIRNSLSDLVNRLRKKKEQQFRILNRCKTGLTQNREQ